MLPHRPARDHGRGLFAEVHRQLADDHVEAAGDLADGLAQAHGGAAVLDLQGVLGVGPQQVADVQDQAMRRDALDAHAAGGRRRGHLEVGGVDHAPAA